MTMMRVSWEMGPPNAIQRPRLVASLKNRKINRVACGSAHTLAWSISEPVTRSKLPGQVPLEFDHLKEFSPAILRNRLVLLQHFSDTFCPGIAMFPLGSGSSNNESMCGVDKLRTLPVSSEKEAAFRKVLQATMVRVRQHGPVLELNRFGVKTKRSKNNSGGGAGDGRKSVFNQMVTKASHLNQESLLLPQRVWKVKFVGKWPIRDQYYHIN